MTRKLERISELRQLLWYNHPPHVSVATLGPCSRCATGVSRGAGLCPECLVAELAEYVGKAKAARFLRLVKDVRKLEREMDEPE